jgi:hypothetical protein
MERFSKGVAVMKSLGRQRAQLEAEHLLEELVGRKFQVVGRLAQQVLGRIGLRIEVDDQGAGAARGRDGRQVAGDGALADAAFLIENNALHAASGMELRRILPLAPVRRGFP